MGLISLILKKKTRNVLSRMYVCTLFHHKLLGLLLHKKMQVVTTIDQSMLCWSMLLLVCPQVWQICEENAVLFFARHSLIITELLIQLLAGLCFPFFLIDIVEWTINLGTSDKIRRRKKRKKVQKTPN